MTRQASRIQYAISDAGHGETAYAGAALLLETLETLKFSEAVQERVKLRSSQGYTDAQQVSTLLLLHLLGGQSLEDLDRLHADSGLHRLLAHLDPAATERFRNGKGGVVPSPDAASRYLNAFAPDLQPDRPPEGRASLLPLTPPLVGLLELLPYTLAFAHAHLAHPIDRFTLDLDACIAPTYKADAFRAYTGIRAYQPMQVYVAQLDMLLHTEFRHGNCPARWRQLEVLMDALDGVPAGVTHLDLRADTAGYDIELMRFCAEGRSERFGVIDFALGVPVTEAFKTALREVPAQDWHPLWHREPDGQMLETSQEWAEVCFVPNWQTSKSGPVYRYLAIREPLAHADLPAEQLELPFATVDFAVVGRYKVYGVVTTKEKEAGDEVLRWHRGRCGKSEHVHSELKRGLGCGRFPSEHAWGNAAWWILGALAYNVSRVMSLCVLEPRFVRSRLKKLRFSLFAVAGRVVRHAGGLRVWVAARSGLGQEVEKARQRLAQLRSQAPAP